jgi:penicillin amidase
MSKSLKEMMGDAARARLNVGLLPRHGGACTPRQSACRAGDFRQTNGPSCRVVVDAGQEATSQRIRLQPAK